MKNDKGLAMKRLIGFVFVGLVLLAAPATAAVESESSFALVCKSLGEQLVSGEGVMPQPPHVNWGFKLAYTGGSTIKWFDEDMALFERSLKIIFRNNRLITAVWRRPVKDGVSVFSLDLKTGLMNRTVTTLFPGIAGGKDWVVTSVETFKCR